MEFLLDFLPIIIYILLIILISFCIYFVLKAIKIADKVNLLLEDVESKISSLDAFFKVINFTTEKINAISERVVDGVISLFGRLFHKRKEDEEDYE